MLQSWVVFMLMVPLVLTYGFNAFVIDRIVRTYPELAAIVGSCGWLDWT